MPQVHEIATEVLEKELAQRKAGCKVVYDNESPSRIGDQLGKALPAGAIPMDFAERARHRATISMGLNEYILLGEKAEKYDQICRLQHNK